MKQGWETSEMGTDGARETARRWGKGYRVPGEKTQRIFGMRGGHTCAGKRRTEFRPRKK